MLKASDDDRRLANPKLPPELCLRIATAKNLNNSDIDFCEDGDQLLINYSWGNQQVLAVGQKGPGRVESGPFWMIQDFPP